MSVAPEDWAKGWAVRNLMAAAASRAKSVMVRLVKSTQPAGTPGPPVQGS